MLRKKMHSSRFACSGLIGLLVALISACGPQEHKAQIRLNENMTLSEALQKAEVSCDLKECPSHVGLLLTIESGSNYTNVSQCTGFLVGPNLVATNSHCIPPAVKDSPSLCKDKVGIKFHGQDFKTNEYHCEELVDFSPLNPDKLGLDYAFFRIDPTRRPFFSISQEGLQDGQHVKSLKVDPLVGGLGGRLNQTKCQVVLNSFFNVHSVSAWSETGLGYGCKAQLGNSGAPVINQADKAIGILQAVVDHSGQKRRLDELEKTFSGKLQVNKGFKPFLYFSNLSCIPSPQHEGQKKAVCRSFKDRRLNPKQIISSEDNLQQRKSDLLAWAQRLPPYFLYEIHYSPSDLYATTRIHCILDRNQWPAADRDRKILKTKIRMDIQFKMTNVFDESFRIRSEVSIQPIAVREYQVSAKTTPTGAAINLSTERDQQIAPGVLSESWLKSEKETRRLLSKCSISERRQGHHIKIH